VEQNQLIIDAAKLPFGGLKSSGFGVEAPPQAWPQAPLRHEKSFCAPAVKNRGKAPCMVTGDVVRRAVRRGRQRGLGVEFGRQYLQERLFGNRTPERPDGQ
jgi:hypothetical protein